MKIQKLLPYLLIIASSASIFAAPSEINYQGVLTDPQGNPINGVRSMQIKIYDAATGGTLLYSEDLGNVPVQDGIYSFAFGANGTSNALTTETIAIANGTVSTFQKVLSASTVVAGSVTVTDGTYTWDQTNGSSNENDFSVAYSPNLRRVTVTYYTGTPAAGKTITATFRSPSVGISGALGGIGNAWTEVSIGGTLQNPRQKILTVPFAYKSINIDNNSLKAIKNNFTFNVKRVLINNQFGYFLPMVQDLHESSPNTTVTWLIPRNVSFLKSFKIKFNTINTTAWSVVYKGAFDICIKDEIGNTKFQKRWIDVTNPTMVEMPVELAIPFGEQWTIEATSVRQTLPGNSSYLLGGARLDELYVDVQVIGGTYWE